MQLSHKNWLNPGGQVSRRFLFFAARPGGDDNGIYVGSLDPSEVQRVMAAEYMARYAPPGYLLYAREGTLMAQPFDAHAVQLTGDPVRLVDQVNTNPVTRLARFSVSENGELAYRGGGREAGTQLVWFDRSGELLGEASQPGLYNNPALSPDETRVAMERREITSADADIWILDLTRGTTSRFTFEPGSDQFPTWSPDGREIAFGSTRSGRGDLYRKNASGTGEAELLLESETLKVPMEWSQDGAWLSFYDRDVGGNQGVWVLPSPGILTRSHFCTRRLPSGGDGSPLTAGGWRICRMSRASLKSTCRIFPNRAESGRSQRAVAPTRSGEGTETSCSISASMAT